MFKKLKESLRWKLYKGLYKPGHYYSPIPLQSEVLKREKEIFSKKNPLAVDLKNEKQEQLWQQLTSYQKEFNWPENKHKDFRYYTNNNYFNKADGFALYGILREFQPKVIYEVGSGFSSALMLDINDRLFDGIMKLNFIEPFPERLNSLLASRDHKHGNINLIKEFIQDVDPTIFGVLNENDILFIDSSHISKVGSDFNFLLFQVLPRLKQGVIIHFHDICYPFEYPVDWIKQGIYWNEAYMLHAFLMYNNSFEILLFNNYWSQGDIHSGSWKGSGGSLWLKKI